MNITSGKIQAAQKVVIYGPEGIGKSTLAARFPNAIFIDTEGSTKHLDVRRFDRPSSWTMLLEQCRYVRDKKVSCGSLCLDTADWAESLCSDHVCSKAGKKSIEEFGYGNGYTYLGEEFGRLLNLLDEVVDAGINVVVTAHAAMRKFEQPDEMGSYDRWEMKLGIKKTEKRTAALLREWADMVLFVNYKTFVIATDDKGTKHKAQGGQRVMYTTHHPCWDAKNRVGLPDELPLDYSSIAAYIPDLSGGEAPAAETATDKKTETIEYLDEITDTGHTPPPAQEMPSVNIQRALAELMKQNGVTAEEIQNIVAIRGYYPADTPIDKYDSDFVNGVLVGAWEQVFGMVKQYREVPFN